MNNKPGGVGKVIETGVVTSDKIWGKGKGEGETNCKS